MRSAFSSLFHAGNNEGIAEYRQSAHAVFDLKYHVMGRSSRHLQADFPELRKRFWGQHIWARGFVLLGGAGPDRTDE
jgi:hypothetical protein